MMGGQERSSTVMGVGARGHLEAVASQLQDSQLCQRGQTVKGSYLPRLHR